MAFYNPCLLCFWVCLLTVLVTMPASGKQSSQCISPSARVVDLTQNFASDTIYWADNDTFSLEVSVENSSEEYWVQLERISEATHGGTHLDAPIHLVKEGWDVADIPVQRLMHVPIVKLDIRDRAAENPDYALTVDDILKWEKKHGKIPHGSLFLMQTGQSRFWPNRTAYMGIDENGTRHYPCMTPEGATFLTTKRSLYGAGVDGSALDCYPVRTVHRIMFQASLYLIQHLSDLSQVPPTGALAAVMPMKIAGAGAAPLRIVAIMP
ncbi:isatin hydrolase-like isoform X2 [Haemaphysalis longicornis]